MKPTIILTPAAALLAIAGCATTHAYHWTRGREGVIGLPVDAESFPKHTLDPPTHLMVPLDWHWPLFGLVVLPTLALDAVTMPAQAALGLYPYGRRWKPKRPAS